MDSYLKHLSANSLQELLSRYSNSLVKLPSDPSQRIFWPFLLSSLAAALIYSFYFKKNRPSSLIELIKIIFSSRGIFHKSSILDFKLLTLNSLLKIFLFPLFLFSVFSLSTQLLQLAYRFIPHFSPLQSPALVKSILATIMAFTLSDFLRFLTHLIMHKIPLLRNIHRTHHTAQILTPFTLFRVHPLESIIGTSRNIAAQALFISSFIFIFGGKMSALDILGVNAFGFLFNALGSNLRHMPIPIGFGVLEYIFISPRMHQIHHSNLSIHQNKNYGVALSLWDHLFRSFYRPTQKDLANITYGLTKTINPSLQKEATQLRSAVIKPLNILKSLTILKTLTNGDIHEESNTQPFNA